MPVPRSRSQIPIQIPMDADCGLDSGFRITGLLGRSAAVASQRPSVARGSVVAWVVGLRGLRPRLLGRRRPASAPGDQASKSTPLEGARYRHCAGSAAKPGGGSGTMATRHPDGAMVLACPSKNAGRVPGSNFVRREQSACLAPFHRDPCGSTALQLPENLHRLGGLDALIEDDPVIGGQHPRDPVGVAFLVDGDVSCRPPRRRGRRCRVWYRAR